MAQPGNVLTRRQKQILQMAATGHSNKLIANTMGIALRTVKHHFENIFKRLGAEDRAHAVAIGLLHELIVFGPEEERQYRKVRNG